MRKNGFTLIELLAVIVILAIIALIATPIILGIINDAREQSEERSIELYASAVRNAIASYQLTTEGNNAPTSFGDLNVEKDGDINCTKEILYEDGSFYLGGCTVNSGDKEYTYGIERGKLKSVCKPASGTEYKTTAGTKYNCKVDPDKPEYTFYVLTTVRVQGNTEEGTTPVNLIMDSNIRTGGEAVKEANPTDEQKGLVAWVSKTDYTRTDIGGTEADYGNSGNWNKGPITAIEYLQNATSGWSNVNPQTISTFNDQKRETYPMAKTYTVNARMPYLSEVYYAIEDTYLLNYLEDGGNQTNIVSGVRGYWTLSAHADISYHAKYVSSSGNESSTQVKLDKTNGVRPVINLSI